MPADLDSAEQYARLANLREPTNGLGIAGFVVSLIGFLSCGLLSPVGAVLSFIAIFKRPRLFAALGLALGIVGSGWLFWILFIIGLAGALAWAGVGSNYAAMMQASSLQKQLDAYEARVGQYPPTLDLLTGTRTEDLIDPWGTPYTYALDPDGKGYTLISAGHDKTMGTVDDAKIYHTTGGLSRSAPR